MGRILSENLAELLPACRVHTTLEIRTGGGDVLLYATNPFSFDGTVYDRHLTRIGEIKQSVFSSLDRTSADIQNVDDELGLRVLARDFDKAEAIIGRYFEDVYDPSRRVWEEIFRGEIIPGEIAEETGAIDILDLLAAAGYRIADWTFSPPCPLEQYSPECGADPALPKCSKTRATCVILHRFAGMEPDQSEIKNPVEPPNPFGDGGGFGGGYDNCFAGKTPVKFFDETEIEIEKLYEDKENLNKAVKCFDNADQPIARQILEVFRNETDRLIRVTFADDSRIDCVLTHPFYVGAGRYRRIGNMKPGEIVITDSGDRIAIQKIAYLSFSEPVTIYNLEIEDFENYVAGGKRVHNRKYNRDLQDEPVF